MTKIYNWFASITTLDEFNIELNNIAAELNENETYKQNCYEFRSLVNQAQNSNSITIKLYTLLLFMAWCPPFAEYVMKDLTRPVKYTIKESLETCIIEFCHGITFQGTKFTKQNFAVNQSDRYIEGFNARMRSICVSLI